MPRPEHDTLTYRRPRALRRLVAVLVACLVASPSTWAEATDPLSDNPGYFPLEELDVLSSEALSIEINLHGAMLKLIAAATRSEEPEFSEIIANLDAVRVRIAPVEDVDPSKVRAGLGRARGWLEKRGWSTMVRTREGDDELHIYLRQVDGDIAGIAIMAIEAGGEAALINIVGKLDLSQLGRLGETLDIPQLSKPGTVPDAVTGDTETGDTVTDRKGSQR
ncbi:MAG: DUF4252 domain-containing protein [Acidobacteriota bacterium]